MILKFKTEIQNEFKGLYDWCISTYFDEVFYSDRDFREVLYEKMCEGKTYFLKTGLNIFSRTFPPTNNGKLIHQNVGVGSLWTSDDGIIGIYGNKVELFNMKKVFVKYHMGGCHECLIQGDDSPFEDSISFFHIKFIDFDFIVRSNELYRKRTEGTDILCYDYFSKNMEKVYQLMEKRAITVEHYMKTPMKFLIPQQVVFLIKEMNPEKQFKYIDKVKIGSDAGIVQQYGLLFYGKSDDNHNNTWYYARNLGLLTYFNEKTEDKVEAVTSYSYDFDTTLKPEPWICEIDNEEQLTIDFFNALEKNLITANQSGIRETEIRGIKFTKQKKFIGKNPKTLGCYMIVKDEEKTITKCLNSIIEICDEIVIVDTGCKDNTVNLAKQFGNKVKIFNFRWCDDFSAARNFAMSKISTDYSFTTDADEEFTPNLVKKVIELKENGFSGLDCIDIYLWNYNGSEPSTYLGGRQIVKNYPENIWKYRVHEKLYFKRDTSMTIWIGQGYILHKHNGNINSQSNYNKYAEWYYKDLNTMSKEQFLSRYNGAHYYYYLFYTLRWMDIFRAKQALAEVYNKDRIMSYTEEQRSNLYTSKFISFEELFAYEMLNNCTDYYYMANIANELNEELPKYLLLHKVYEELGHLPNETAYINLSYIAYKFGLMDEFRKITGEGLNLFPQNGTIRYNSEFWVNTVQEKYEKTLVLYSTKHLYDESSYNYFSHMFRKVIITDDTSGNLGHYLINLDEVGQLSRDKAIKEYENILFDRPSDIIRKIGCWS